MAEVFSAQDVRLGRTVAVKLLRADLAEDDIARLRFTREAHAVAALNHHSIVAVYDTGEEVLDGDSTPYIVMELVEGRTVRELLVDEEAPPVDQALIIIAGVLEALAYSHKHGIVHRDIKPANVIITSSGAVKVMDFGIARALTGAATTMTQTGMVMGTPQYLSPEQALGLGRSTTAPTCTRLGCMLYELLALRPPFTGETPLSVVYQHVQDNPVPPSRTNGRVPAGLDDLVLRSLAKNPDDRYQTADEFRAHVQHALRTMHGAQGVGYAAGAAAAAAAAAGLAASVQGGNGNGNGQPGPEGTPNGGTAVTEPIGRTDPADPTAALPFQVTSPYQTPSRPYQPTGGGQGYGGQGYDGDTGYGGGGGHDGYEPEDRRSPWGWVLGVLAVLVAAGVGIGLALSGGGGGGGGGNTPTQQQTQTTAPADTGQPTEQPTSAPPTRSQTGTTRPTEPTFGSHSPTGSPSPTGSASPTDTPSPSPTPTETKSTPTPTEQPTSAPPTPTSGGGGSTGPAALTN
ncbi:protein kinase [Kitasatospora arboriphila]